VNCRLDESAIFEPLQSLRDSFPSIGEAKLFRSIANTSKYGENDEFYCLPQCWGRWLAVGETKEVRDDGCTKAEVNPFHKEERKNLL
jgi:hypothetical protein